MKKKENLGRGHKQCPKCEKVVGPRTIACECGYKFKFNKNSKPKSQKKVVAKKTAKIKMAGKGHKNCPSCQTILWANTHVCPCGHKFPVKKAAAKKIVAKKAIARKTTDGVGTGHKQCPSCKNVLAARANFCSSCGFQFVTKPRFVAKRLSVISGGKHTRRVA
jgi:hypothetical protein